jgi:hypothetical protein
VSGAEFLRHGRAQLENQGIHHRDHLQRRPLKMSHCAQQYHQMEREELKVRSDHAGTTSCYQSHLVQVQPSAEHIFLV